VKLWQRRAVRQMVFSVLPLVVVCVTLILVLGIKASNIARQLSPATARAPGVVAADGTGSDGLDIAWTDSANARHTTRLVFPNVGKIAKDTKVTIFYVPDDPSRAYAAGDRLDSKGRELASGVLFAVLVLLIGVFVTAFRLWRRRVAEKRAVTTLPVRWAQYRRGLIRRSWIIVTENNLEWWVPVYWEPGLASILAGTPAKVHGKPALDRLLVIEVDGMTLWPSGRRRPSRPRGKGDWIEGTVKYSKTVLKQRERDGGPDIERISLGRHLAGDAALILPAPVLGLVWSYVDSSGPAGFGIATLLVATVLFWLPGVFGSDPS
jgi:hypothetical protein